MAEPACKVLVVDDHVDCAASVEMLLIQYGHEVRTVFSAHEAEALVDAFQPHVVLMDLGLPGKDGYDLGREIKVRCPECRIIALTGYGDAEAICRSVAAGFEDHLVKPAEPAHLIQVVEEACSDGAAEAGRDCPS